ncbi:MAG: hypothetical protein P8129_18790 [Anaerolineae bacterium]
MTTKWVPPNTQREWEQARRTAFVQDVLGAFTQRQANLLPFEEVRCSLHLRNAQYLGLQDVPLDQIAGSVGRYQDFTRAFFPRRGIARDRWREIARLTHIIDGKLPPVELYKVGHVYFVRDGNHRISVARQQKMALVPASVWDYETRVPLDPETARDDLLRKAALASFLEKTDVDRHLCDDMSIELSEPDGYEDLLQQMESFQYALSQIDREPVDFAPAVALWCEMCYSPIVEIMRQAQILDDFPDRTEADLYLWLCRSQEELALRYGQDVLIEEAAEELADRFGGGSSPARQVRRALGRVGELGARLVRPGHEDEDEEPDAAGALLASVRSGAAAAPLCRFCGQDRAAWSAWQADLRHRLWDLLGVGQQPWQVWDAQALQVRVEEEIADGDVVRELIWYRSEGDLWVPAYVFRPHKPGPSRPGGPPRPAIVFFPGHGTIDQAADAGDARQRGGALALARAGFVVLAVEPRGFGRLGAVGHLQLDGAARLVGRTWYGLLVHDGLRALDYLATRPDVDAARLGVAGIGAGGGAALYTAALDDRARAAVMGGYLGRYVMASLDEERCPCSGIPGILRYAEMGDVAALVAPRPALYVNGRQDPTVDPGARDSFAVARHVYQVLDVPLRVRLIEPETLGHAFDSQLAAGWFRRWL